MGINKLIYFIAESFRLHKWLGEPVKEKELLSLPSLLFLPPTSSSRLMTLLFFHFSSPSFFTVIFSSTHVLSPLYCQLSLLCFFNQLIKKIWG